MRAAPTSRFITLPDRPDSLRIHYWEWSGRSPTVLICHAGSFHGRCYDHLVDEALNGLHVIALDFRGHGQSQKHRSPHPFYWFGEDLLEFIERLNLSSNNLLGIGHSLGGHALVYASAIASRPLFRALLLFDPAIYAPSIYRPVVQPSPFDEIILGRTRQWSSVEAMIAYMEKRKTFAQWPPQIIRNYCTYGLDEQCQLACTPEQELSLYRTSIQSDANLYSALKESKFIQEISVHIVRIPSESISNKFAPPATASDLVTYFRQGSDTPLTNASHMFPMEQSALTIRFVQEFIVSLVSDSMLFPLFRRMMSSTSPTSHRITLPDRPIVEANGTITRGPLQLHYWEWQGHTPTVLICHGGMLHGRCYDRLVKEALAGYHVIALDFRGHGQSQKHPPPYPFAWFGEDLLRFIQLLNLSKNPLLAIGHSLGGHAITLAAAVASERLFQSILLLEPGIYSAEIYRRSDRHLRKRPLVGEQKMQWSSIENKISYMDQSGRLAQWPKDILHDYCTYGLNENFELQCTPQVSDYLYRASLRPESDIYSLVKNSTFIHQTPVHIVRAAKSFINSKIPVSPVAPDLWKWFGKGRDTFLPDSTHSFPQEQPEIAVDLVKQMLDEIKHQPSRL